MTIEDSTNKDGSLLSHPTLVFFVVVFKIKLFTEGLCT